MSLYLRLVIGRVVICDVDMFAIKAEPTPDTDPPPWLAGGSGTVLDADEYGRELPYGFTRGDRP